MWSLHEPAATCSRSLAAAGAGASCGYSLAGRGSFLPDYIRVIAIPLFTNRTPYVTVEQLFTEKVRVEFQSRGRYSVKSDRRRRGRRRRGARAISLAFTASPIGFTDQQLATRYRFTVTVSVKFDDMKQQKTLWENPALAFSDEYELASAPASCSPVPPIPRSGARRHRSLVDRLRAQRRIGDSRSVLMKPADVRPQIQSGETGPLYLLEGDDLQSRHDFALEFAGAVDEGLQAFNVQSFHANEAGTAATRDQMIGEILSTARTLPMMAPRRILLVHEAERLLAPKQING